MTTVDRRSLFLALCLGVFIAGLVGGAWSHRVAEKTALEDLETEARRSAVAFQGGRLRGLTGTPADIGMPLYENVKERLMELRRVQPGVRFVYLFRPQPATGRVIFLADSEPSSSKDVSLPGDDFPQAPDSPGLQSVIATGRPATEGPLRDDFGTWVTAYAPVQAPADAASAAVPADILGVDVAAHAWSAQLMERSFRTSLYIWVLLGLPLATHVLWRRWSAQSRTIRKLSQAVEQSRSALLITEPGGRIDYANRGLCEQTGYAAAELAGRDWSELRVAGTPPEAAGSLAACLRDGTGWEGTWVNRRKSGEDYPVHGTVSPVRDDDGRLICFITTLRDMTEERRVEDALREAGRSAEAGERAKSEFLDTMSHELRTPLNGIVGFTSLLLDTPLSPEQREYVQTVRSSGETLLRLTGDILDYSRMESRPPSLEPQPCDVRGLVEEVLDLLAGEAAGKGLQLLHQIGPDVPAVVEIDAGRLRQVLLNLAGNAVKFTDAGEVEVRVRLRPSGEGGAVVLDFAVRDTGPGIAEEEQGRLFQPFTQLDGSLHRRHGGAGMGLALSRSLVRLMGGEIVLQSEPGNGSVFRFDLPARLLEAHEEPLVLAGRRVGLAVRSPGLLRELMRVVSAAGAVPVACRLEDIQAGAVDLAVVDCDQSVLALACEDAIDNSAWPAAGVFGLVTIMQGADDRRQLRGVFRALLRKPLHHASLVATLAACLRPGEAVPQGAGQPRFDLRVLIVDDNAVNLRLLQGIVTTLGCRSVAVSGGRECLDALRQEERFDMVLLDLHMPDMDGAAVLRRIRAGEAGEASRGIWVTIVTADARLDGRAALFELGCNDFVAKPVTLANCIAALQRRQPEGRA